MSSLSTFATALGRDVFVVTSLRWEEGGFQRAWIANAGRCAIAPDQDSVYAEDVGHGCKVAIGYLASSGYRLSNSSRLEANAVMTCRRGRSFCWRSM